MLVDIVMAAESRTLGIFLDIISNSLTKSYYNHSFILYSKDNKQHPLKTFNLSP